MKISKFRLFRILFALLIVIYLVLNTFDDIRDGKVLLLIGIVISILLIYNSRKFKPLFLMMIFFFSYIFNLIDFYWNSTDISGGYQTFDIIEYYNYTLKIHVYFLIFLFASFPIIKDNIYFNNKFSNTQSRFLFILTISFTAFIFLFVKCSLNSLYHFRIRDLAFFSCIAFIKRRSRSFHRHQQGSCFTFYQNIFRCNLQNMSFELFG